MLLLAPFTDFQIISFRRRSGTLSALLKSSCDGCRALASNRVRSRVSDKAGRATKGAGSGRFRKQFHSGVAAASYWLIGGNPNINSIVLNTEDVE
jgi:hypothetical protein